MQNQNKHTRPFSFLTAAILISDGILLNIGFLLSFLIRYGIHFPQANFNAFKTIAAAITLLYLVSMAFTGVFKNRFRSSWQFFCLLCKAIAAGTFLSVVFAYVFRQHIGSMPTSIFAISFIVNLLIVYLVHRNILKFFGRICKKAVIIGSGDLQTEIFGRAEFIDRLGPNELEKLLEYQDLDEIVVSEQLGEIGNWQFILYFLQKANVGIVFEPDVYMKMLQEKVINGSYERFLNTFFGRKNDMEEFLIRSLDIIAGIAIMIISLPLWLLAAIAVKLTSKGPLFYKQQRVGKDGRIFTLLKFRTMIVDAEKHSGPVLSTKNDPRVTPVGRIMRSMRIDELPQLFNIIKGEMSLVGPRPERPHFVKMHKALQGLRLSVKPGLTGLAQIRSFYDLKAQHKLKYDYLYIQKRSFLLNAYILLMTVPVMFSKKGW